MNLHKGMGITPFHRVISVFFLLFLTLCGVLLFSRPGDAAPGVNEQLNFQGRLFNSQGAVVPDGLYNIQFKIYQDGDGLSVGNTTGSPAGSLEWTESYLNANSQGVMVKNGYMSVQLGSITAFGGSVDWNQDTLWLSMNIGSTNGSCTPFTSCTPDGEMVPMKRISASPYALNSKLLGGLSSAQFIQSTTVPQTANIAIQSSAAGNVTALIQGASSQTADLIQAQDSSGNIRMSVASSGEICVQAVGSTCAGSGDYTRLGSNYLKFNNTGGNLGTELYQTSNSNLMILGHHGVTIKTQNNGANTFQVLNSSDAPLFNVSTSTNNVALGSGVSLSIAGGNTGSRPASPTEGMVYFDSDTDKLLVYSNGKWQQDRTDTVLVAANNSSQSDKDAADFVADGNAAGANNGDQVQINSALTAGSGKKVVLLAGTYVADATISVPNNTTLAGVGSGTLVELGDLDATDNLIENSDTTTGTGVTIRDLKINGRSDLNTAGTQYGIYLNGMGAGTGAAARQGARVLNVTAINFRSAGVYLNATANTTLTGNTLQENSGSGLYLNGSSYNTIADNVSRQNISIGMYLVSSTYNTFTGNTAQGNTSYGISATTSSTYNTFSGNGLYSNGDTGIIMASSSSNNTVIGNTASGNSTYGIWISAVSNNTVTGNTALGNTGGITLSAAASNNTVTGNTVHGNSTYGVYVNTASGNTISGNRIHDSGGATYNDGIYVNNNSDGNVISNNTITDTGCSTTCHAINIFSASADNTYLSDNIFSTSSGTATLNDAGTGTIYAGQAMTAGGLDTRFKQANSATAFQVQNAAGTNMLTVDSSNGEVEIGSYNGGTNPAAGKVVIANATNANTVTVQTAAVTANRTVTFGDETGTVCLQTSASCGFLSSTTGVQLQASTPGTAQTGNFNIAGTGIITNLVATAGIQTPLVTSANNTTLAIQGGAATIGNNNGSNLLLSGGTGAGTGASGLVVITTPTFQTATSQTCAANCTITQANVDNNSAVIINATASSVTATLPDPSNSTAGRVVYVTAANGSEDFTLQVNGGGVGNLIAMRQNTTATMIWNGADWTAAGASSSTTLQSAYDNTLQSAGGAELVVSKTASTNGLTIRDSTTNSVNDTLLSVQSSSAASLFSVNSNVKEYVANGGAETAGASSTTFPASTWSGLTGATVTRQAVAGNFIATGQGSVATTTTATANAGPKAQLTSALNANTTYNVSFTTRLSSGTFTDMNVYFSNNGTAATTVCTTSATATTSVWSKVNCSFTTPASGIVAGNAIFIRQTAATARTFYIDNLSVTIAADYNFATDGGASDGANFATNWSTAGLGTATASRNTSDGYNASDSAQIAISAGAANAGIRNKLSSNPLPDTLYRISVYAKLSSGTFTDFKIRYSRDGSTTAGGNYVDCVDYNKQVITTSGWTQITCYIKTDVTAATNPHVYFVETASAARTFMVDAFSMTLRTSTTPNVQIGGGVNGGPTTLLTLDKGASAPIASDNDALLGSMYYDTSLGKLQCYEADGWGACGSSPDNVVTISPEYTNAVLHGTGIGTMTSDICSDTLNINDGSSSQPTICGTNETYNFYKWTSPQASAQTYGIYVTYQLPNTFKEFASGQTSLMARTDSANSTVTYQIYRSDASGLTACGSAVNVSTGVQSTWQTATATGAADPSTCGFAPGNSVVFKINITASNTANAYVGNLNFLFSNR